MIQTDYDPEIVAEHAAELAQKGLTFMGVDVFEPTNLWMLLIRFAFNLLICWFIIQVIKKTGLIADFLLLFALSFFQTCH